MVKVFVVLGLALLAGGAYAIFDGWPYRVLERGFTEVILGALSAAAGLLLLAAAAILAEIRRLKTMVAGAMAAVSLGAERYDEPALARGPVVPRNETPAPEPDFGTAAVAAGAGAIALGGGLAGLAQPGQPADRGEEAADAPAPVAAPPTAPVEDVEAAAPLADDPAKPEADLDHDDWLLPPAARLGSDPAMQAERADRIEPDFFEAALLPTPAVEQARDIAPGPADGTQAPESEGAPEAEPVSENQSELEFEPEAEAGPEEASTEAERSWWPRLDRIGEEEGGGRAEKPASDPDDFSALREQLTDALGKPGAAPDVEPPRRSLDVAGDWMAPRPWPPVTQPRSSDALDDLEEPAAASGAVPEVAEEPAGAVPAEAVPEEMAEETLEAPASSRSEEGEPAPPPESATGEIVPEAPPQAEEEAQEPEEEPAATTARGADLPPASDEGIVGAYQVGETHFTIYADGSIQARTPDGDYVFASMDELKAYLASEKSRLESGSG